MRPTLLVASAILTAASVSTQQPTLLADLNPGAANSIRTDQNVWLHPTGNFGVVLLDDGTHGHELWRTDGTPGGTWLLFDSVPGPQSASITTFQAAVDEEIWFVEIVPQLFGPPPNLWRTDGSSPNPTRILDGSVVGIEEFGWGGAAAAGDGLVFVRRASSVTWELWRVDVHGNHHTLWTDPAPAGSGGSPYFQDSRGGASLFVDVSGNLHLTDGSVGGTVRVGQGQAVYYGRALGGFLVRETVTLPGPVTGTRVSVVRPGVPPIQLTFPTQRISTYGLGDRLWVLVDDRDLLVVDGGGATRQVATFVPDADPRLTRNFFGAVDTGTAVLFFADGGNGSGRELWRSDGTVAGTTMVADLNPGPVDLRVDTVLQVANRMVFWAATLALGSEPWSTDGTAAGTVQLGDLEPGPGSSRAAYMFWPTSNSGLLAIGTSAHGLEPWYCDGTAAGTRMAADIRPGPDSSIVIDLFSALFFASVVGDRAVFPADDGTHGVEWWTVPLPTYLMPHATTECGRHPDLDIEGWPRLGGGIELKLSGLAPTARGAVVASLPGQGALLTVEGCGVYVDPGTAVTAGVVVPNAGGSWSASLAIPNHTSLIGVQLAFQTAMLDASAPAGWRPGQPWRVTLGR